MLNPITKLSSITTSYSINVYAPHFILGSSCTNGSIRLINGTLFEGRAEYCFEGEWVPLCGLSAATASTICQQLGFETNCKNN